MKLYDLILVKLLILCYPAVGQQSFSLSTFQEGKALYITSKVDPQKLEGYSGNGFALKKGSHIFMITNRHNVEMEDYYTHIPHSPVPYNYVFISTLHFLQAQTLLLPLRTDTGNNYYENTYKGRKTDLVSFYLGEDTGKHTIHPIDYQSNYTLKKGDDVFCISILMAGGTTGSLLLCGKVISDPSQDCDTEFGVLPVVKIDRASMQGMSGSPVFVWPDKKKPPVFVGILSGNDSTNSFFWRKDIVMDLLSQSGGDLK